MVGIMPESQSKASIACLIDLGASRLISNVLLKFCFSPGRHRKQVCSPSCSCGGTAGQPDLLFGFPFSGANISRVRCFELLRDLGRIPGEHTHAVGRRRCESDWLVM